MSPEPQTARGQWFWRGNAVRGSEHKLARDILAIEAESRTALLADLRTQIQALHDGGTTPYEQGWDRAIDRISELLDEP